MAMLVILVIDAAFQIYVISMVSVIDVFDVILVILCNRTDFVENRHLKSDFCLLYRIVNQVSYLFLLKRLMTYEPAKLNLLSFRV